MRLSGGVGTTKTPEGQKLYSPLFYRRGSHLRVEEKVSGGGGAVHYNTQAPSVLAEHEMEGSPQGTENYSSAEPKRDGELFRGSYAKKKKTTPH